MSSSSLSLLSVISRTRRSLAGVASLVGLFVIAFGVVIFFGATNCARPSTDDTIVVCQHGDAASFNLPLIAHRTLLITVALVLFLQFLSLVFAVINAAMQSREDAEEAAAAQAAMVRDCNLDWRGNRGACNAKARWSRANPLFMPHTHL